MSVLLETSLGDVVMDLDVEGSPLLAKNFLRLVQARYYTQTLLFSVVPGRCVYGGDPVGNGTGGACADALLSCPIDDEDNNDALLRHKARFLASQGRRLTAAECREKGRVVAVELQGLANTVGSQFLITIGEGPEQALDGYSAPNATTTTTTDTKVEQSTGWLSLGKVVEDDNQVLDQLNRTFIDQAGRPYADIRIRRALIVYNPFSETLFWPRDFLEKRGIQMQKGEDDNENDSMRVIRSPSPERPVPESVQPRIPIEQVMEELQDADGEVDPEIMRQRLRAEAEADRRQQDASRARVLEMLGDLPDAQITAPKNVLFCAKLNPITTDEDLQLIFSRFDPNVKVDIIRDHDTGQSLQYAFCAFTTEKQAVEAYFKMNQALVDDRRILVDFSQSVSHVWDKYRQQYRNMPSGDSLTLGTRGGREGGGRRNNNNRSSYSQQGRRNDSGRDRGRGREHGGLGHGRDYGHRQSRDEPRIHDRRPSHDGDRKAGHGSRERDHGEEPRWRTEKDDSRERYDRDGNEEGPRHGRARADSDNDDRHRRHKKRYDSEEEERRHRRKERRYDSDDSDRDRKRRRKEKRSHQRRHDSDESDDSRRRKKKHKRHHHHPERDEERRRHRHRGERSRERDDDDEYRRRKGNSDEKEARSGKEDSGIGADQHASPRDRREWERDEQDDYSKSRRGKHDRRHRDRNDDEHYRRHRDRSRGNGSREADREGDSAAGREKYRENRSEDRRHRHRERGRDDRRHEDRGYDDRR